MCRVHFPPGADAGFQLAGNLVENVAGKVPVENVEKVGDELPAKFLHKTALDQFSARRLDLNVEFRNLPRQLLGSQIFPDSLARFGRVAFQPRDEFRLVNSAAAKRRTARTFRADLLSPWDAPSRLNLAHRFEESGISFGFQNFGFRGLSNGTKG